MGSFLLPYDFEDYFLILKKEVLVFWWGIALNMQMNFICMVTWTTLPYPWPGKTSFVIFLWGVVSTIVGSFHLFQWFSNYESWPLWGLHIRYPAYHIFSLWFITAEFQLWSSIENNLMVGVTTIWENELMGHSIRKFVYHWSVRFIIRCGFVLFFEVILS